MEVASQVEFVKQVIEVKKVSSIKLTINGDVDANDLKVINKKTLIVSVDFEDILGISYFQYATKDAREIEDLLKFVHETVTYVPISYDFNQTIRDREQ